AWPLRSIGGYVYDATPDALYHAHKRAIVSAGVPYVTPHGLRHSVASSMAATGTPIKVLQALLGHSRYQLTADLYADHIGIDAYRADMATFAGRVI
ncbi:MAG: tyrosine-type recombinase/integrase, partial [Ruthenibacterium sp.]